MKDFAFNGGSWTGGNDIDSSMLQSRDQGLSGQQGRDAYLDFIADDPDSGQLPATPTISYTGTAGFPTDLLQFESSAFSDPQRAGSFAAIEWRIGEIEDPTAPGWDPDDDFILENDLIWGSGELAIFQDTLVVPGSALRVGHTYRARVRHKDNTGRWSHWSPPVEFTTTEPQVLGLLQANLMITEIMYHPGSPTQAELDAGFVESDFEFVEIHNISTTNSLDLAAVRFTKGVDFDFVDGAITSLAPGGYALVVHNLAAFEMRYGAGLPVAGVWRDGQSLSNGGEQLKLSHGAGTAIHDFEYDDRAPWPETPDGSGVSLVLIDPASAPDHGLAASWQASVLTGGSPGASEPDGPFAQWMAANGLTDPLAKDHPSGLSNLLVFGLGADLATDPGSAIPVVTVVDVEGSQFLALQYRRRIGATDLDFVVELSTDLARWEGMAVPVSTVPNGDGTETVTVRASDAIGTGTAQYLRVRASIR